MSLLKAPQGEFELVRIPRTGNPTLRAWDAADEYLLNHLAASADALPKGKCAILNDGFGALAVALADRQPQWSSDSQMSRQAAELNLELNGRAVSQLVWLDGFPGDGADEAQRELVDLVLIKVPKTLSLLEDQLYRLRPHLAPGARVLGAGMVKNIHTSTLDLFTDILGATTTSLAKKKARLIFCDVDKTLDPGDSPYPSSFVLPPTPQIPSGLTVVNHAGVFSRQRLDQGTRLLLEAIPEIDILRRRKPAEDDGFEDRSPADKPLVVDLGCGNGVVGTVAAQLCPVAELVFLDESHRAVASARETFRGALGDERVAVFRVTNFLAGVEEARADLILNNPPFHQQEALGDAIAWTMFTESKRALRSGGSLYVVGNRHLGYHVKLDRIFRNHEVVASNKKFVVLRAVR
jgi:23S rRNA (guanine1835-N2)-methyltransferase